MPPSLENGEPLLPENSLPAAGAAADLRPRPAQSTADMSPSANASAPAHVTASLVTKERRRSPRFLCSGSAELQADDSDVRMSGRLTDISLHGCYVEMPTTFPAHTRVMLAVESLGIRARTAAAVCVSYPFLGMGLSFTDIEPRQQRQLEQLLRALAGQRAILNSEPSSEQTGMPDIVRPIHRSSLRT